MPPKFKFTKQEIVQAALTLIRRKGWHNLSTRALANELGSSAKPIYSFFKSMDSLEEECVKESVKLLYEYMIRKRTGDPWIDHGIGYVKFAQEEKYLFLGSNSEKNIKYQKKYGMEIWNTLTKSLSDYPLFKELSEEQINNIQTLRWLLAHGLAFQVCNPPPDVWNDENIVLMIKQGSMAIFEGLKKQYIS